MADLSPPTEKVDDGPSGEQASDSPGEHSAVSVAWTRFPRSRYSSVPRGQVIAVLVAAGAALAPMLLIWGFTVDDALISARVAWRIANGYGYRYNCSGPPVDAVTPLGWALLLVPWARTGPLAAWSAARWLGGACWLAAAGWLGARLWHIGQRRVRFAPLLVLSVCAPLAAWAVSGMETGFITLLATVALGGGPVSWLAAGLAAGLRPELLPWAVVLCCGRTLALRRSPAAVIGSLGLALLPTLVAGGLRWHYFGQSAPLSVVAKPSDAEYGLNYTLRALLWCGPPWLLAAPLGLGRVSRPNRVIVLALVAHIGAVVLAGGDWMALFRLFVPVLPGALLVAGDLAEKTPWWANLFRYVVAIAACGFVWVTTGRAARSVSENRLSLMTRGGAALAGARHVGALDVGWVGVATRADVFDLAGVTDPTVARLPGGHTSKRLTADLLESRDVDALVLMLAPGEDLRVPWESTLFARAVEVRVAWLASGLGFEPTAPVLMPAGSVSPAYVVLRRPNVRRAAGLCADTSAGLARCPTSSSTQGMLGKPSINVPLFTSTSKRAVVELR